MQFSWQRVFSAGYEPADDSHAIQNRSLEPSHNNCSAGLFLKHSADGFWSRDQDHFFLMDTGFLSPAHPFRIRIACLKQNHE